MRRFLLLIAIALNCMAYAKEAPKLVWPQPPEEPRIEFVKTFTNPEDLKIEKGFFAKVWEFIAGENTREIRRPFGVHIDSDSNVYVTDIEEKSVFIFKPKSNEMEIIDGFKETRLQYPVDVDTDEKGNIYIADSGLNTIVVYNKKAQYVRRIGNDMTIRQPTGIAVNNELKRLYVVDTKAGKIHMFSLGGKLLGSIGKIGKDDGEFNKPTYMAIGKEGKLYVSDSMNHRVQILDKDGNFIGKFGKLGNSIGSFSNPRGIALDAEENVYVTDTLFNTMQIFDSSGTLLLVIGRFGNGNGAFNLPEDVAISKEGDIYIAELLNKRVQVLRRVFK